jgi:hypothetical protein
LRWPAGPARRNPLKINNLHQTTFKKRAKSQKKIFTESKKNRCIFARLWYLVSMTEKEIQLQALTEKLEQIAEDLIDPMLDDQTTVLLHAMRKTREKINALLAE